MPSPTCPVVVQDTSLPRATWRVQDIDVVAEPRPGAPSARFERWVKGGLKIMFFLGKMGQNKKWQVFFLVLGVFCLVYSLVIIILGCNSKSVDNLLGGIIIPSRIFENSEKQSQTFSPGESICNCLVNDVQ